MMIKDEDQSWFEFVVEIVVLIALVLFIRFYIFQLFRVSGPSMCPTLNVLNDECFNDKGEFIFVNEFLYHFMRPPERGEIVVFKAPGKDVSYIKRVIGMPGDTVEIRAGKVYLSNDQVEDLELDESYLSARNQGRTRARRMTVFEVPEGQYLLIGDNRAHSLDARHCFSTAGCNEDNTPYVPKRLIRGRAEFVLWPTWKMRKLENSLDESGDEG